VPPTGRNGNGNGAGPRDEPVVSSPAVRRRSAPVPADPLLAAGLAPIDDDVVSPPAEWLPEHAGSTALAPVPTETMPVRAVPAVPVLDPGFIPPPEPEPAPAAAKPARARRVKAPTAPRRGLFRRRPRVRRVTRVVRRVDPWGVLKVSVLFYVLLFGILLVAGVLLWNLARTTGTVENIEGFVAELFGLQTFTINGPELFRASWTLGGVLVIAGTGFNVTCAVLFNLLADLVGGVRVTVLEEETVLRPRPQVPSRRRVRTRAAAVDAPSGGASSLDASPGL
jgi:hypothetical protein